MLATDTIVGGRYRLGSVIGRGGGADVYRSEDLETGRFVAVKVLRSVTPTDLKRFEVEANTLGRLDHPAIVRMCDRGTEGDVPYLVLDLIDGEPLSTRLGNGPLDTAEVARIGSVLAGALAHAHDLGVVHRDVKPGNVLFDADNEVHLTDFGIARLTDVTSITTTGFVVGTPAYLAPEQVTGDPAGPAADVYALGLVLIEALTARREFDGPPSEAAFARLQRQPSIPSHAGTLGALLAAMTAANPRLRPSAASASEELTLVGAEDHSDATTFLPIASDATTAIPTAPVPGPPTPRRRSFVPALVAVGVAIAVLVIGLLANGGETPPATADTPTTPTTLGATTTVPTTTTEAPTTTEPRRGKGKKED